MTAGRRSAGVTPRTVQVGLGALWLLDGLLQLQPKLLGPAFASQVIAPAAARQPPLLAWPIDTMARLVAVHPAATSLVFAGVQILVGIGLLRRETVRPALALSFAWAAGVWVFGEGYGMLLTGTASPLTGAPGAVLLYAVVGLLVWPRTRPGGGAEHTTPAAGAGPLGEGGARVVWAVVWLAMAALWLAPASSGNGSFSAAVDGAAASSPGLLAHAQTWLAAQLSGDGAVVASVLAVASAAIAVGPLVSRRATAFLVAGAALSIDCWIFGQSLGGFSTGLATDPNAGPLFVLFALALYPGRDRDPASRPATVAPGVRLAGMRAGGEPGRWAVRA